ncbi:Keratin, type I cytoskeletal 18 [Galemys pyrenaicus]|uniref:Keratin, type I cytoskeletal 18 n=1 Tax=Galemys pyrenaicus TaxID=202257 RepID=A0A8J5ZZC6_GALPY|nr:Keratin, type I cytoskeletal 18 [Galemys pyrenaicus]
MSHNTSFWGSYRPGLPASQVVRVMTCIQSEKQTMQDLKECLTSNVRISWTECKTRNLEKKQPQFRNWGYYFITIRELKAQLFASSVDNACIVLQNDWAVHTQNVGPSLWMKIKVKLEHEVTTHLCLLEDEEVFSFGDNQASSNSMQTILRPPTAGL